MRVFSATAIQISGVSTPSMSRVTIDCFTGAVFQNPLAVSSGSLHDEAALPGCPLPRKRRVPGGAVPARCAPLRPTPENQLAIGLKACEIKSCADGPEFKHVASVAQW